MSTLSKLVLFVVGVMVTAVVIIVPKVQSSTYNSTYETAILHQINIARQNSGKKPVQPGYCIDMQAERWAHHLAETNSFYHQNLSNIFNKCGGTHVGEIMGQGTSTPREFRRAWLHSPAHRRVMLGSFDKAGVSAVETRAGIVVVVDFIAY